MDKITKQIKQYYDTIDDIKITVNDNEVKKGLLVEVNKTPHAQSAVKDIEEATKK